MADKDLEIKLENHDQQIKSLKHRMDNQEEQTKVMQELIVSVKLLAVNMENMLEAQKSQGARLEKLESEPGENWKSMKRIVEDKMSKLKNKQWWEAAGTRAIKTVAQSLFATIGAAAVMSEVDWKVTVSAAALAGILSVATSLTGLPEVEE
ncbi:putative lactococcus lactis phage r1t holin [Popillia japonica]|uniref:Lactococcus lactis phage r1t holin n=1 Tax=Popillia japonica TaxID=7064 RepID=A0AAW1HVC7_POPJA